MAPDILKQLQDNYELLQNKLIFLQREKIIKVDAATRFQLEQEIKEVQTQIQEVAREIKNLQAKPSVIPTETPISISSSMKLSGEQRRKLQLALLDAFRSKSSLEQMLSFELEKNLYTLVGEGSLQDIVFKLIQTAEAEDWIKDLVCAARQCNDGNSNLKMIAEELL
jgi:predicted RNase H-like nuclease (RuvC/YqgF family)